MNCPECGELMTDNAYGMYVCDNCEHEEKMNVNLEVKE